MKELKYILKRTCPKGRKEDEMTLGIITLGLNSILDKRVSELGDYKDEVIFTIEGKNVEKYIEKEKIKDYAIVKTLSPDYMTIIKESEERIGMIRLDEIDKKELDKAMKELNQATQKIHKIQRGIMTYFGRDHLDLNSLYLANCVINGTVDVNKAFDFEKMDGKIRNLVELRHEILK